MMQLDSPEGKQRKILAFSEMRFFYNFLMDRLEMILWRYYLGKDKPFYLFINALPRGHEVGETIYIDRFDVDIINVGVEKLRELREGRKEKRIKELDEHWKTLDQQALEVNKTVVGSDFFKEFQDPKQNFELADIAKYSGSLKDYFAKVESGAEDVNPLTIAEFEILSHPEHLGNDLYEYLYVSLPLFQFGELDGVVHIIYHEDKRPVFFQPDETVNMEGLKNLIRNFSDEYERLFVEWYYVYIIYHQKELNYEEDTIGQAIEGNLPTFRHDLMKELEYAEYYKKYQSYFRGYFFAADQLVKQFRARFRHIAILQILIDSYAHNISAHSLAALQWFFRQRAFPEEKGERSRALQGEFEPLLLSPATKLDRETYFLIRFMWEKGAYWSGLVRDNQFGGKISSLYSVLWYDFINNPLYLGTIAFSEGIQKININVSILEREHDEHEVFFRKKIVLNGTFATIDLTKVSQKFNARKSTKSQFVIPGEQFKKFERKLKEFRAFFPGGVVGRHAFFTILENEIRNVKHYAPAVQEEMREKGLTLNISIEEDTYQKKQKESKRLSGEYYKIGVCLEHLTDVSRKLVQDTLSKLEEDIIGPDNRAKLGGIYQDKICAAMLLNNTFISVQEQDSERGKRYYPWIKLGFRYESQIKAENITVEEIEISHRKFFAEARPPEKEETELAEAKKVFAKRFYNGKGFYKKIFHIWKGEREFEVDDSFEIKTDIENLSRFMFLSVSPDKFELKNQIRAMGLFRLLPKIQKTSSKTENYWNRWIGLLKGDKQSVIQFLLPVKDNMGIPIREKSRQIAQLYWNGSEAQYYTKGDMISKMPPNVEQKDIYLIHGGEGPKVGIESKECRYRSLGMFNSFFCAGRPPAVAKMDTEFAAELFEIFDTQISIFDNRLAERLMRVDKGKLTDALNCFVYNENEKQWRNGQKRGLMKNHFLIIHLSFIDQLMYKQGMFSVGEFILKEIVGRQKDAPDRYNDIPEHFVIVVTSGRGRADWWDDIRQFEKDNGERLPRPITSFVTFKPIEVLSVAIENALTMGDDIELKYRLVKTLFGS